MAGHILIPNPITAPSFNPRNTVTVLQQSGRGLNQYLLNKDNILINKNPNTITDCTNTNTNANSNANANANSSTDIDINSSNFQLIDASATTVCNNNTMVLSNPNSSAAAAPSPFEDPSSASWPPRSYHCSFCNREFRSAQALGGHMNVHRRDRARLRHSSPTNTNPNPNTNLSPHSSSTNEELNLCSSNSNSCSTSAATHITNNNNNNANISHTNHTSSAVINFADDCAAASPNTKLIPSSNIKPIFNLIPINDTIDTKISINSSPVVSPKPTANYIIINNVNTNNNIPNPITENALSLSLTNQLIPSLSSLSSPKSHCNNSYINKNIINNLHNHNPSYDNDYKALQLISPAFSSPSPKHHTLQSNNQSGADPHRNSSNPHRNSSDPFRNSSNLQNSSNRLINSTNRSLIQLKSEKPKKKFAVPFQPYINLQSNSASSSLISSSSISSPTKYSLIDRAAVDVIRHSRASQINCDTSPATVVDLELRL